MSTAGQGVGGIVGAIAGALLAPATAGASLTWGLYGAQIGMIAGGLLDPPKGPSQHGPSPDQLRLTTSTYGANIPRVYGTCPVAGNVVWLEGDKYRVKKKKSGGKGGGSVTTYKIFATFAVVLCEGPIVGIRRLWLGSELVYDGAAATTAGVIKSGKSKSSWKLYTGTDTQQPDPRYQADKGANAASGWPGLAYIVFYDLPLEKWQNTLAGVQIKAEIVASGSVSETYQSRALDYSQPHNNPSFPAKPYYVGQDAVIFYSPQWQSNYPASSAYDVYSIYPDGPVLVSSVVVPGSDVPPNAKLSSSDEYLYSKSQVFSGNGVFDSNNGYIAENGGAYVGISTFNPAGNAVKTIYVKDGPTGVQFTVTANADDHSVTTDGDYIYVVGNTATRRYDKSLNLMTSGVGLSGYIAEARATISDNGALWCMPTASSGGASSLYKFSNDLAIATLERTVQTVSSYSATEFSVFGDTVICAGAPQQPKQLVVIFNWKSIASASPTLASIVQAECLRSNLLTSGDLDVTGLASDTVRGFRVSDTGPIRASLEPLSMIWPFDCRMHGYKLQFVRRGGASVASIPAADLDARVDGADTGPLLTLPRDMDTQLPQKVVLGFLDVDREYDRGEQESARYNTDAATSPSPRWRWCSMPRKASAPPKCCSTTTGA